MSNKLAIAHLEDSTPQRKSVNSLTGQLKLLDLELVKFAERVYT